MFGADVRILQQYMFNVGMTWLDLGLFGGKKTTDIREPNIKILKFISLSEIHSSLNIWTFCLWICFTSRFGFPFLMHTISDLEKYLVDSINNCLSSNENPPWRRFCRLVDFFSSSSNGKPPPERLQRLIEYLREVLPCWNLSPWIHGFTKFELRNYSRQHGGWFNDSDLYL